jgi:hemerythrin-like domain-containing protein
MGYGEAQKVEVGMKIVLCMVLSGALLCMQSAFADDGQRIPLPDATQTSNPMPSPTGFLMQEHGELLRIILIYEECIKRISNNIPFESDCLSDAASIVHQFLQNFHEKLEEEFIFTRLENAGKRVPLIQILREQHIMGSRLTDYIIANSDEVRLRDPENRKKIVAYLRLYIDMYLPHAAFEDTEIFPAFRALASKDELDALGALFRERQIQVLGENAIEKINVVISHIESLLGIDNIAHYTARVTQ